MVSKIYWFILMGILIFSEYCFADQWVNPKELIGDPGIARLQQGRKELYDYEKEDIKKYGYTGLELMTYVDVNKDPGKDSEAYFRTTILNASGITKTSMAIRRWKFYKDYKATLIFDGIKPGDVLYKGREVKFIINGNPRSYHNVTRITNSQYYCCFRGFLSHLAGT